MLTERNRKLGTGVLIVFVLVGTWALIARAMPFAPFRLYSYEAVPQQGCPAILLDTLTKHYDLVVEPWQDVGRYVLKTNWERVDEIGSTNLQEFKGDFSELPRGRDQREVTPHLRTAPPDEGAWRIHSEFVISGSVLGYPRQQIINDFRSDTVYRAAPPGTEGCPL